MEPLTCDSLLDRLTNLVNTPEQTLEPSPETATKILEQAMELLQAHRPYYHWVGLYGLIGEKLYLGPYCGPPTDHVEIPVGRGVCGTAVKEQANQRIDDVRILDNYLACNLETKSELVVLIWNENHTEILGQIDIDGSAVGAFSPEEESFINKVSQILAPSFALWLASHKKTLESKSQLKAPTRHRSLDAGSPKDLP